MPFLATQPEQLFGVELSIESDRTTLGSMPLGPAAGALGSVGVLVDDLLGYAVNTAREQVWSVTTSLAVELVAPLPTSGRLHGRARLVSADERGALARAELLDDDGRVVLYGIERGRFLTDPPLSDAGRWPAPDTTGAVDLLTLLGDVTLVEGGLAAVVTPRLANPRGNLHGGIAFALAELTASLAVPQLTTTTAVTVHYLRPGLPGARLVVEPVLLHHGRTLALVEVVARTEDGKAVFRGTVTRE